VSVKGIPAKKVLLLHFAVDKEHSNSYELWKKMGSPANPTAEQISELEKSGQLQMIGSPTWVNVTNGELEIDLSLERQGVSLLKLGW
jgi:xylan 1,4-beta-xylosidase